MRNVTRTSLAIVISCCGLLYSLPSMALLAGSGAVRPVQGESKVYESYIDQNDCTAPQDNSHIVGVPTGVATGYYSDVKLSCPANYAMVDWKTYSIGTITTVVGGYVYRKDSARCCAVKYRWVTPKVKA